MVVARSIGIGSCVIWVAVAATSLARAEGAADSSARTAIGDDRAVVDPGGRLTLGAAMAAARRGNPALRALAWEIRARDGLALQAGLRPNPVAGVTVEDVAGTGERRGADAAESTLGVSQLVELGGKRAGRERTALLDRDLARWDYASRRREVLADVRKAYVTALAAQERVRLTDELLDVARRSLRSVRDTVRAGAVSPVEETRAAAALGHAEAERLRMERDVRTARIALAATWGSTSPRFGEIAGDLTAIAAPPPLDALIASAETAPDLARWHDEIAQREAALRLERAARIPDVTVGGGVRHYADRDDVGFVLEASVPVPILDRNQGAILAAASRLSRGKEEHAAAIVAVQSALAAAREQAQGAYDQSAAYRLRIIPHAHAAFEGAHDGYRTGLFRYVEVLDAQRTLFQTRLQYIHTLAEFHTAMAEIERLGGTTAAGDNDDAVE